jgi:hypothetical protein
LHSTIRLPEFQQELCWHHPFSRYNKNPDNPDLIIYQDFFVFLYLESDVTVN